MSKLCIWEKVLADLGKIKRIKSGQNKYPTLIIINAQSEKTLKKPNNGALMVGVKGRKRQIAVDTMGNLHEAPVHRANIHHSKGNAVLAHILLKNQKKVKKVLADLGI